MTNKKLLVIFPGGNYTADMPLLYYAKFKYDALGYESVKITYNITTIDSSFSEMLSNIKNQALAQLDSIEFSQYDDLVFISKSIGTVIAAQIAIDLSLTVSHIFLTPIENTLQYINLNNVKLVIYGSLDRYLHSSILKAKCEKENVNYLQIDGVGHRLEKFGDMEGNIEILMKIVKSY
ncbi:MAG: hypothetical protein Q8S15_00250 [Erysipelotrichaceae bacterium]|nr:hypothetical protein [Erysipelotrichaceae bacterium]